MPFTGLIAWMGFRFVALSMFMPSWGRRVRLLFDWFFTPLLGREIVNPRIPEVPVSAHSRDSQDSQGDCPGLD